jgi:hypothetical protein
MIPKTIRTITPTDGWDRYIKLEREQLAQRADGKMARMIGKTRPGEDQAELDLIISDDAVMAQNGYVPLRQGSKVWHTHIDTLAYEERWARIEYEKTLVMWLKARIAA